MIAHRKQRTSWVQRHFWATAGVAEALQAIDGACAWPFLVAPAASVRLLNVAAAAPCFVALFSESGSGVYQRIFTRKAGPHVDMQTRHHYSSRRVR